VKITPSSYKILLVSPSYTGAYQIGSSIKEAKMCKPPLGLVLVAAPLIKDGHEVRLLDLELCRNQKESFVKILKEFQPDYLGITSTTPNYFLTLSLSRLAKKINNKIKIVVGGVHASILPEQFIKQPFIDYVIVGEGDFAFAQLLSSEDPLKVEGVIFKRNGQVIENRPRGLLQDLDKLPLPAWQICQTDKYINSYLNAKKNPVGNMESSRGCVFGCVYCNKKIFGRAFRAKSTKRFVDEVEHTLKAGFNEIHIQDDAFSTNLERAKEICDEIIRRELKFSWNLCNGIRADKGDLELFQKLRQAGCYRIAFGIESGNQMVLDGVQKSIRLDQIRQNVFLAKKAGLEILGFFMLGLPKETEKTMQETINFAKELEPDLAKFAITVPYPGTPLYEEWNKQGYIKTKDWTKYLQHGIDSCIYDHPNLDWQTIRRYYKKAYRDFYLRPKFILKRIKRGLSKRTLLKDVLFFTKTSW